MSTAIIFSFDQRKLVEHNEGENNDDDLSVSTIKVSNVGHGSKAGDSRTLDPLQLLLLLAFIARVTEELQGKMSDNHLTKDDTAQANFYWLFLFVFSVAVCLLVWRFFDKTNEQHKPTYEFGVTTQEAVEQLRSIIIRVAGNHRGSFLQLFKDALNKKEDQVCSENWYRARFVSFDVTLDQPGDFEFLKSLNFSRATAKAAIDTLLREYPAQTDSSLQNCGSSDASSTGSTESAKERKRNSSRH